MSQRLRQLMVLMLIALQFAAPLVHAHIGAETGRQVGLHMHQLEAYSAAVLAQQLQTTDDQAVAEDQPVIDLGSAIKPLQDAHDFLAIFSWQHDHFSWVVDSQPQLIRFFHPAFIIPVTPQPELQSTRAPPV